MSLATASACVCAADTSLGIVGKNQWLFYRYELAEFGDEVAVNQTLDLIRRFNKVLASNGVTMVVAIVPIKMRIYAQHLPDDIHMIAEMKDNYERVSKTLRAGGVQLIDLQTAFLNHFKLNTDEPLYFRLDTHWSMTGAMAAAEAVKAGILGSPGLRSLFNQTPPVAYKLVYTKDNILSNSRDLVGQLPPNQPEYAPEVIVPFVARRMASSSDGLLGDKNVAAISLVGSSYSRDWTGFSDGLRYVLQRDVLSLGVPADHGAWVGMETYLRNDAFQLHPPKILILEMPERELRAPPDYKYRDARYASDNFEWLLRASAWAQSQCKPSAVHATVTSIGLLPKGRPDKVGATQFGATKAGDFVEIAFDRPLERLDYLSIKLSVSGSKFVLFEGSGTDTVARRFTIPVSDDDEAPAIKMPLPSVGRGFTKLRIIPGKSSNFVLRNLKLCRQPEDLLQ